MCLKHLKSKSSLTRYICLQKLSHNIRLDTPQTQTVHTQTPTRDVPLSPRPDATRTDKSNESWTAGDAETSETADHVCVMRGCVRCGGRGGTD